MTTFTRPVASLLPVVLLLSASVSAQVAVREQEPIDYALINSESFLRHHPDLRYRKLASEQYERGNRDVALRWFRRSARYADKLSQARIAEMLWYGDGTETDRALAYVWMDLAAERGYPALLAWREQYWDALSEAERERALREGPAIYDEYGDDVAKPRIERELRLGQRGTTGSRTGSGAVLGQLTVTEVERGAGQLIGQGASALQFGTSVRGDRFYDRSYWEPELYWQWQDKVFEKVLSGEVDIGEIVPVEGED